MQRHRRRAHRAGRTGALVAGVFWCLVGLTACDEGDENPGGGSADGSARTDGRVSDTGPNPDQTPRPDAVVDQGLPPGPDARVPDPDQGPLADQGSDPDQGPDPDEGVALDLGPQPDGGPDQGPGPDAAVPPLGASAHRVCTGCGRAATARYSLEHSLRPFTAEVARSANHRLEPAVVPSLGVPR